MLGACGVSCIGAGSGSRDILSAVHLAAQPDPTSPNPTVTGPRLTHRELEVLSLLCAGRTYVAISVSLEISIQTVKAHIVSVLRKLNITSKRELRDMPMFKLLP
ncbi:MAG: helix-turn-helix domain-containing protein [Solirubrobacteraceae bacterium]